MGWLFLLLGGATCGWAGRAQAADPRVLVLTPAESPGSFLAALQIQLVGLADPQRAPQPKAASTAEQIAAAAALARDRQALAAIWIERPTQRPDGSRQVVLYVVGEREGRALIEVVRVPGSRGPELDRTLALKVREIVGELRRSQTSAPAEALLLPPPAAGAVAARPLAADGSGAPEGPTGAPSPAGRGPRSRLGALGQLGVRLGSQPRIGLGRWGLGLAVGPTLALDELRFGATLGLDWFPSVTAELDRNRASFWELAGTLALHAQLRAGRLWFGAQTGPQRIWMHASGITAAGNPGDRATEFWAWNAGLSAEAPIDRSVGVALELQLQALLRRQGFRVNGRELVDMGSARMRLGLALTYRP